MKYGLRSLAGAVNTCFIAYQLLLTSGFPFFTGLFALIIWTPLLLFPLLVIEPPIEGPDNAGARERGGGREKKQEGREGKERRAGRLQGVLPLDACRQECSLVP